MAVRIKSSPSTAKEATTTGHRAFGQTVGHTNSNCRSLGIVVGDWGVRCEIEVSDARVGDANVTREDIRGGRWNGFRC